MNAIDTANNVIDIELDLDEQSGIVRIDRSESSVVRFNFGRLEPDSEKQICPECYRLEGVDEGDEAAHEEVLAMLLSPTVTSPRNATTYLWQLEKLAWLLVPDLEHVFCEECTTKSLMRAEDVSNHLDVAA